MKRLASPSDESERMTMIIVTHEMSFAHDIADRIIFMNDGIIDSEGSPSEMFSSDMSPRLSAFLKSFKREF
jgi:ABC-type polar amino acid transport system ATPase subunit